MKVFRYFTATAAIIGLVACQNDDLDLGGFNTDPDAIHIQASVGEMVTRSNPIDDNSLTLFNKGDRIAVSVGDGLNSIEQGPVVYKLGDNGNWTPENGYLKWNKEQYAFMAYYPAGAFTGNEDVPTDQSDADKIAAADYMWFRQVVNKQAGSPLKMEMQRRTARIVIKDNYIWKDQYLADDKKTKTHEVKSVHIHSVGKDGIIKIIPYKVGGVYYALVNPNKTENATSPFITLKVGAIGNADETTYDELVIRGIPELKEGNNYNCQLTLGKDKAFVSGVEIVDWATGDIIDNGQALDDYVVYQNSSKKYIYDIYTLDGLLEVNKILSAPDVTKEMLDAQITLHNDFVLPTPANGEKGNWKVIGNENKPFRGDIIGNNHTIYGLVIDSDESGSDIGMFGDLNGGIKDLTLVGCKVKGNGHVGGFVGYRIGSNEIHLENCTLKATKDYPVVIESTASYVGGIVGSSVHENLVNCSLICEKDATITIRGIGGNAHYVGGIAGRNDSGTTTGCKVINNGGKIGITNAEGDYVAGLIGKIEDELHSCSVSGATITGRNHVGGLLGYLHEIGRVLTESKVEYCTITGQTNTSATYGSKHANSYWTPKITIGEGNTVNGVAVTPSN